MRSASSNLAGRGRWRDVTVAWSILSLTAVVMTSFTPTIAASQQNRTKVTLTVLGRQP